MFNVALLYRSRELRLPMRDRLVLLCKLGNGASGVVYKVEFEKFSVGNLMSLSLSSLLFHQIISRYDSLVFLFEIIPRFFSSFVFLMRLQSLIITMHYISVTCLPLNRLWT